MLFKDDTKSFLENDLITADVGPDVLTDLLSETVRAKYKNVTFSRIEKKR